MIIGQHSEAFPVEPVAIGFVIQDEFGHFTKPTERCLELLSQRGFIHHRDFLEIDRKHLFIRREASKGGV
jgi:hypothetical protein